MVTSWSQGDINALEEATQLISRINVLIAIGTTATFVPEAVVDEIRISELTEPRWRFQSRRREHALVRAQQRTYEAIAQHVRTRSTHSGRRGLVDELMHSESELDERSIVLALRTMLLAGYRVPAAALTWTWYELATHPAIQDRARSELTTHQRWCLGESDPLSGLRFCQAVVQETLRLHPPVWNFKRRLTRPIDIGGQTLPEGAFLLFSNYVNQRDESVYPNPHEFEPERWLTTECRPRLGSYFPFGAGPRYCPGSQLALSELTIILATVLPAHRLAVSQYSPPAPGVLHVPGSLRLRIAPVTALGLLPAEGS